MYKYKIPPRAPVALWMLDNELPFFDATGSEHVGEKKSGTSDPGKSVPLVNGAEFSSVFSSSSVGKFESPVFVKGLEDRSFVLEAWILPIPKNTTGPQQILSHDGYFDGLAIDGKSISFSTIYENEGQAKCEYELPEYMLAHVVGIYNNQELQLWVNGVNVSSRELTDEQKEDSYITTDGYLYCGATSSTQQLAVNALAIYSNLPGDIVQENYSDGISTIGQSRISVQKSGTPMNLEPDIDSIVVEDSWSTKSDFDRGLNQNVMYGTERIVPMYAENLSVAGTWTIGLPLDLMEDNSIYGVAVSWSGKDIVVETSIDRVTWVPANNGELISSIPNGFDPTGIDLEARVSFAGGIENDPAYLENLSVVVYRNNNINNITSFPVTLQYPAIIKKDFESNLYRDDNGVYLGGGSLTIGPDDTLQPESIRSIEMWIKTISGMPSIAGITGSRYRNSKIDSTLPVGEWSLVHIVSPAGVTNNIVVSGNAIIGQIATYDVELTVEDIEHIYRSYSGGTAIRILDNVPVAISESPNPVSMYHHDWSITAAG